MSTVEEVKAGLAGAIEEANNAVAQARAATEAADRMIVRLRAVAQGTNHPKTQEAIAKAQQCKQRLADASTLARAATQAARDYIGILG